MTPLSGRHAVLTGASRGLGVTIARALARRGVNLTLTARSAEDLERVQTEMVALGVQARSVTCDVNDPADRARLLEQAERGLGPVDILVNNAGVEMAGVYWEGEAADIASAVGVNLTAPMLLCRAVVPGMLTRGRGHIVNMASLAGRIPAPYEAAYSATKCGLVGFTLALRAELAGTPVGCSVVCPGFVADDGMYARWAARGVRAPVTVGTTSPERVAGAVLSAILRDRAEVLVSRTPLRPAIALSAAVPAVHGLICQVSGVTRMLRAAGQRPEGPN